MTYVVWVNQGTEGYTRSDDFEGLDAVLNFIAKETYGHDYEVTRLVSVQLMETPQKPSGILPGVINPLPPNLTGAIPGARGIDGRIRTYEEVLAQQADPYRTTPEVPK